MKRKQNQRHRDLLCKCSSNHQWTFTSFHYIIPISIIIYSLTQNCGQYIPFKTSKLCMNAIESLEYRWYLHWLASKARFFSTFPATMASPRWPSKLFAFSNFVICNYRSPYQVISPTSLYLLGNWVSYKWQR